MPAKKINKPNQEVKQPEKEKIIKKESEKDIVNDLLVLRKSYVKVRSQVEGASKQYSYYDGVIAGLGMAIAKVR